MKRSLLVERVISTAEILERNKKNLPEGVLCRARYNICNINELNRNKRIYERDVWESVLKDPDISEKLDHRTLYMHAEHPDGLQSNTEKIAGIVSAIEVDEARNKVYAVTEILDTPYGRICDTLLRAGCGLGTSTRAEGELEECESEERGKHYRVIPESYKFITVDFTADPSTYGSYPMSVQRDVVKTVKQGRESHKIDDDYAAVLLEKLDVPEAKLLLESIKKDLKENGVKAENKGVYYADYDEGTSSWGVFNTDNVGKNESGFCFSVWATEEQAEKEANKLNRFTRSGLKKTKESIDNQRGDYSKGEECPDCGGTGDGEEEGDGNCSACGGKGTNESIKEGKKGFSKKCPSCKGEKRVNENSKTIQGFEFEVEVDDFTSASGKSFAPYTAVVTVEYQVDRNYGADSDGNRGIEKLFIEDVQIDSVKDENGNDVKVTSEIESAVNAKLEDYQLDESVKESKNEVVMKKKVKEKLELDSNGMPKRFSTQETSAGFPNVMDLLKEFDKLNENCLSESVYKNIKESKTTVDFLKTVSSALRKMQESLAIAEAERDKVLEFDAEPGLKEKYMVDVKDFTAKIKKYEAQVKDLSFKLDEKDIEIKSILELFKTKILELRKSQASKLEESLNECRINTAKEVADKLKAVFDTKLEEAKAEFDRKLKESRSHYEKELKRETIKFLVNENGLTGMIDKESLALLENCEDLDRVQSMIDQMRFNIRESNYHNDSFKDGEVDITEKTDSRTEDKELTRSLKETNKLLKHVMR